MTAWGRVGLVVAFGLTALERAAAQGTPEQRAACTPDALRLCSSEIPDVGRVFACMKAKRGSLSPGCRAVFPPEDAAKATPTPATHKASASRQAGHSRAQVSRTPARRRREPHLHPMAPSDVTSSIAPRRPSQSVVCDLEGIPVENCGRSNGFLSPLAR
jgi:hypothetical protein